MRKRVRVSLYGTCTNGYMARKRYMARQGNCRCQTLIDAGSEKRCGRMKQHGAGKKGPLQRHKLKPERAMKSTLHQRRFHTLPYDMVDSENSSMAFRQSNSQLIRPVSSSNTFPNRRNMDDLQLGRHTDSHQGGRLSSQRPRQVDPSVSESRQGFEPWQR